MTMINPPHPGGLIAEYLEDYGISLRALARDLDVSRSALSKVTAGKTAISPEGRYGSYLAARQAAAFA